MNELMDTLIQVYGPEAAQVILQELKALVDPVDYSVVGSFVTDLQVAMKKFMSRDI